MSPSQTLQTQKSQSPRDLSVVGDFIKYFLLLFVPFVLIGTTYGIMTHTFFMSAIVNPVIYAGGITLIIVVLTRDVNDIMALIGRAKEPHHPLHVKYAQEIQQISIQMSSRKYDNALQTVNALLREEPTYPNALNLKGQILLDGFSRFDAARSCFNKVMKLADPDTEEYHLAEALKAAAYKAEEG